MANTDTQDQTIVEKEVEQVTGALEMWLGTAEAFVDTHLLTLTSIYQIAAAAIAFALALLFQRTVRRWLDRISRDRSLGTLLQRLIRTISAISLPVCWAAGTWMGRAVLDGLGYPSELLRLVGSLLNAFIVIRIASIFIPNARLSAVFAWFAWSVAALNAVGILDPVIEFLQGTGLQIGDVEVTLWTVVKGIMVSALLVWLAFVGSEIVQNRLEASRTLNSALRLLIGKITRIVLVVIAVVVGLSAVGVDLTAFAVFSGALGIGIGLGLQRTISNLVASFSLLMDRSISQVTSSSWKR